MCILRSTINRRRNNRQNSLSNPRSCANRPKKGFKLSKLDDGVCRNCNANSLRKDITLINKQGLTVPEYMVSSANSASWDPQGTKIFKAPNDASQQELIYLTQNHFEELKFTGGEPTTSPTFWKIIDNIKKKEAVDKTALTESILRAVTRLASERAGTIIDDHPETFKNKIIVKSLVTNKRVVEY